MLAWEKTGPMVDAIGPDARTSTLDAPEEQSIPIARPRLGEHGSPSIDTASACFRLHLWPRPPWMGVHDHVGDPLDRMCDPGFTRGFFAG